MLGEIPILSWKSKAQQKKEQEEYAAWAFPYGEAQKEKLLELLFKVYPKESAPTVLIPFLTCKELYEGALKKAGNEDAAVEQLVLEVKKYKRILTKKTMPTYIAFVLADRGVDEALNYPPVEDVLAKARLIEDFRDKSMKK